MQGNLRHSYNSSQYLGQEFPPIVLTTKPIRMPKNRDILNPEEVQALDYLTYLRNAHHLEVSTPDQHRITNVLRDFEVRGKLNVLSKHCTVIWLDKNDRHIDDSDRIQMLCEIKAHVNYNYKYRDATFGGVPILGWPTKPESTDGTVTFKTSCPKREILDIRRPSDAAKLFCGVMECSGEKSGMVTLTFYDDEESERIVNGMKGNLPAFLYQYCKVIKKYSARALQSLCSSFEPSYRLTVADSSLNAETLVLKTLRSATSSSLASHMTDMKIEGLMPELLKQASENKKKKMFSDAAMERVAQTQNLKDKPGFNTTAPDS